MGRVSYESVVFRILLTTRGWWIVRDRAPVPVVHSFRFSAVSGRSSLRVLVEYPVVRPFLHFPETPSPKSMTPVPPGGTPLL